MRSAALRSAGTNGETPVNGHINPLAAAFSEGCDARLAGLPEKCPHNGDRNVIHYWYLGWRHVDRCWGELARWAVLELPEVKKNVRA